MDSYTSRRMKNDLAWATKMRLRSLLVNTIRRASQGRKIKVSKKYGVDFKEIIEHLKPFPEDTENYHIHHIKPLFTFDFNNPEEIKKAFSPDNHQWATIEEHRKIDHRGDKQQFQKQKCKYCPKVIEGYTKNQVEHLMMQHIVSIHKEKIKLIDEKKTKNRRTQLI